LESEKQSLQEKLAAEQIRTIRLEERVQRLEKICDDADASEADYKKAVDEKQERIQRLEKELEAAENEPRSVDTMLDDGRIGQLETALKTKDAQIAQLTEEIRDLRESAEKRDNALASLDKKYQTAKKEAQLKKDSSGQGRGNGNSDQVVGNLVPQRSAIAEMGRTQTLEAENYQLKQAVRRLDKEITKLGRQLANQEKENVAISEYPPSPSPTRIIIRRIPTSPMPSSSHMRRAISECETSHLRPIPTTTMANSGMQRNMSAFNLSPSAVGSSTEATFRQRLFPPLKQK